MPTPHDPANADLIAATAGLAVWAAEAFAALGVQVWVADDLGFHSIAVVGRDCTDADRDCAPANTNKVSMPYKTPSAHWSVP